MLSGAEVNTPRGERGMSPFFISDPHKVEAGAYSCWITRLGRAVLMSGYRAFLAERLRIWLGGSMDFPLCVMQRGLEAGRCISTLLPARLRTDGRWNSAVGLLSAS